MIYLLFGQPCSGKTTLAKQLYYKFATEKSIHIDGDEYRQVFGNTGYDRDSRIENYKSAFNTAIYLDHKDYTVILSFVCPYIEARDYLYYFNKTTKFVFLEYNSTQEARGREMFHVKDFEEPIYHELINPNFISLNTSKLTENQCIEKILDL